MSKLSEQFAQTVAYVHGATGDFEPTRELQLKMYGLYKQAMAGDVSGRKPGLTHVVARAKYNAWQALSGMSSADAMQAYIEEVANLKAAHS